MTGTFVAKSKITSAFEAINRHDFTIFVAGWSDKCVFIYPGDRFKKAWSIK